MSYQSFGMATDFKINKVKRDSTQHRQHSHIHPYYEIFYLLNGDCTFFIGHDIYRLNQGDLVIVPEGELHKSTYPQIGHSERFVVCFNRNVFEWIRDCIDPEFIQTSLNSGVISIPENRRDYIEALLHQILLEFHGQDLLSPGFVKAKFIEMLLFVIRCRRFEHNVIKQIDLNHQLIQEVAVYIYNHYDKKLSLEEIASQFHISRSYLSKKFKQVTGFGFKEYIINIRIQNACRLLLETNRSVTQIALDCGFSDSNYFGDAFRHVKGVSPHKYRVNRELV